MNTEEITCYRCSHDWTYQGEKSEPTDFINCPHCGKRLYFSKIRRLLKKKVKSKAPVVQAPIETPQVKVSEVKVSSPIRDSIKIDNIVREKKPSLADMSSEF